MHHGQERSPGYRLLGQVLGIEPVQLFAGGAALVVEELEVAGIGQEIGLAGQEPPEEQRLVVTDAGHLGEPHAEMGLGVDVPGGLEGVVPSVGHVADRAGCVRLL